MPQKQQAEVRHNLTESQAIAAKRTEYVPLSPQKDPGMRKPFAKEGGGAPWPKEMAVEDAKWKARQQLKKLRESERG